MSSASDEAKAPPTIAGFRRSFLVKVGVVAAAVWAFAISTGSVVLMSIVGGLTLVVLGLLGWAWTIMRRQKRLNERLQGAIASPEGRRDALAELEADKKSGTIPMIFARAQLLAADDPGRALELLETVELKSVPPQMQDDFAFLRSQLYLSFGRPKDARPLVDRINVDAQERKDARGMLVGVVAETWARTGKHKEALTLLDSVDLEAQNDETQLQLRAARVFAHFASGKPRAARQELETIASPDVNLLGRFVAPRFKVHPELLRLAREVAQKNTQVRPRRGPPR